MHLAQPWQALDEHFQPRTEVDRTIRDAGPARVGQAGINARAVVEPGYFCTHDSYVAVCL